MTSISGNNQRKSATANAMKNGAKRSTRVNGASVAKKSASSRSNKTSTAKSVQENKAENRPRTAIACCVQDELGRYFDMLDGEPPSGLYRMVMRQAEHALLSTVMQECGGNQSRAAQWLGISRGNLRNKLAEME